MEELEKYTTQKITINLIKTNVLGLMILLPTIFLLGLPYYLIWIKDKNLCFRLIKVLFHEVLNGRIFFFIILVLLFGTLLHEIIHALMYSIFAKSGLSSIKIGIFWKTLTPYCYCKEPLKIKHYILSAIMPFIVLGIIPSILSYFMGCIWLLMFGIFFINGAIGDLLIIYLLSKEKKGDFVQDHPNDAGCYIYRKIEK
ncbi:MAG: DUF3267 domain-containing protein [Mangrovibacterium sp.]